MLGLVLGPGAADADVGGDVESDGDGRALAAAVAAVGSESARTTLSTACRSGCTDETRVSRARYDGHAGSSGGAGTYDAMGSYGGGGGGVNRYIRAIRGGGE